MRHVDEKRSFTECASHVEQELAITTDELNDLLRGSLIGLCVDAEGTGDLVKNSDSLWLTIREGNPRLRIYYELEGDTCWLTWLEIDPDWAVFYLPAWRAASVLRGTPQA